jgi:uncharacterized protein (DUF983 family)
VPLASSRPSIAVALARGLRKRCPHCGRGWLFSGWAHHLERCSTCGLIYERNPGDTWAFTVIGDRLPVALLVVALYAGLRRLDLVSGSLLFLVTAALLVATTPNRWGFGISLHYLSRIYWPDPADPIP